MKHVSRLLNMTECASVSIKHTKQIIFIIIYNLEWFDLALLWIKNKGRIYSISNGIKM